MKRSISMIASAALLVAAPLLLAGCHRTVGWATPPDAPQAARQADADHAPARSNADRGGPADAPKWGPPQFLGPASSRSAPRPGPARFASAATLYGEINGAAAGVPDDELDNLQRVTFTTEGADFDADIAPGGKWMVFASTQHRPAADLYMKQIDGTTVTQLTSDPAQDTMPAISPDGSEVCFASNRSGNWDLYIKPVDGGQPVQLTSSPAQELHPSWSPDGERIVFCSLGERSGQWEMVVIDVDNPARRQFIGYGLFPEFSPDGKRIAFQRARYRGTRWFSVWTVDYVDGQGVRPTQIAASANAALIAPAWSPDGKRLAFATVVNPASGEKHDRPDAADLWIVNLDGAGRVRLTGDDFANLQPTWGDDGSIYFVSNRTGADNIWAVRPSERSIAVQGGDGEPKPDAQAAAPTESAEQ